MSDVDRIWYLRRSDGEGSVGPFSVEQLLGRWQKGELEATTAGWKEGMPDWRPLAEMEPFASTVRVGEGAEGIVRFSCECGNKIVMSDKFIGRLAKCTTCGRTVTVYDPSKLPPEEAEKLKKKEKKKRGRPVWLIPAAAVVGMVAIAAVIVYFVLSGSTAEDGPVAPAPQERTSRIARARNAVIDDVYEPEKRVRSKPKPTEVPNEPTPQPPKAAEQPGEKIVDLPEETGDTEDTGQPVADTPKDQPTAEAEPVNDPMVQSRGPEEKAVRQIAKEFMAVFRVGNPTPIERLEELLADDCTVVPPSAGPVLGKAQNVEAFTQTIEQNQQKFRELRVRYVIRSIKVFADSAVMCGLRSEEGSLRARGRPFKQSFWQTLVFEKTAGQWRIVQVHTTAVVREGGAAG
jgi:ketosteroid isomerase-like protein